MQPSNQLLRDPQDEGNSNLIGQFNNKIQRFQNDYDGKKKAVLEDVTFIQQDNERLLKKAFETDTLKERARQRIE